MNAARRIAQWLGAAGTAALAVGVQAATLVVGQVGPLSGLEAVQGRAYGAGLELAFDLANRSRAAGHEFRLVRVDDGGRPEDTVAGATRLLAEQRPLVFSGFFGNRNIAELVRSGLLERERIALVGYRITELQAEAPWMYSVRAGLRDEIQKMAEHLATIGITRVGVLHEDGPGADALVPVLQEILRANRLELTVRATYLAGTARVSPAVEAMLARPPQAILLLASGSAAAGFIEQYRLGGGAAQLFAQSSADIEQLAQRLGEETMKGVAIAQVTPSPYKISVRLSKEFADAVAARKDLEVPVSYAMMEGFIAGKVIVEAARRMGPQASRERFVAALEGMGSVDLGGYRVGFAPGQRHGSRFVELSIVTAAGRIRQ